MDHRHRHPFATVHSLVDTYHILHVTSNKIAIVVTYLHIISKLKYIIAMFVYKLLNTVHSYCQEFIVQELKSQMCLYYTKIITNMSTVFTKSNNVEQMVQ